jgi:hypothetical protein
MELAYTIGRTSSYDQALAEEPKVKKLGRKPLCDEFPEGYRGGSVWRTATEAVVYLTSGHLQVGWHPEDFSVYELELPGLWEDATEPDDGFSNLLMDSVIRRKTTF